MAQNQIIFRDPLLLIRHVINRFPGRSFLSHNFAKGDRERLNTTKFLQLLAYVILNAGNSFSDTCKSLFMTIKVSIILVICIFNVESHNNMSLLNLLR